MGVCKVMKKYLLYIVIFLIGALAGMWAHRQYHFREVTKMSQNDTIVRLDTVRYSRLELSEKIGRLNIPKISSPELVYIPTHSLDTIYRDNVRYVTLPRQYFFTETADAQIWHSGIDSRIDSLNIFHRNTTVTQYVPQFVTNRNALAIGLEARYTTAFSAPVYVQYESRIKSWLSVYARVDYDMTLRQWGVQTGVRTQIQW